VAKGDNQFHKLAGNNTSPDFGGGSRMCEVAKGISPFIATAREAGKHTTLNRIVLEHDAARVFCPQAILGHGDLAEVDIRGEANHIISCPHTLLFEGVAFVPLDLPGASNGPRTGVVAAALTAALIADFRAIFERKANLRDTLTLQNLDLIIQHPAGGKRLRSTGRGKVEKL